MGTEGVDRFGEVIEFPVGDFFSCSACPDGREEMIFFKE